MANTKILKILVTGAEGGLGQSLQKLAPTIRHKFIFTDIDTLDITCEDQVKEFFARESPDWVINCAAYTAVDKAEEHEEDAMRLNCDAVKILSHSAANHCAGIVHISTDYVFEGNDPSPLDEEQPTRPLSVYGRTKLEGEKFAAMNPKHIIIRTSWLYSPYGNNFVKTMLRLSGERSEIGVVGDQWGSPTSARDLARAIIVAIEKPKYGIYHFANEGITSWALFAEEIMALSGSKCVIKHISTAEYPTAAVRPEFSILDKRKFTSTFSISIAEWEASLEEMLLELRG